LAAKSNFVADSFGELQDFPAGYQIDVIFSNSDTATGFIHHS